MGGLSCMSFDREKIVEGIRKTVEEKKEEK